MGFFYEVHTHSARQLCFGQNGVVRAEVSPSVPVILVQVSGRPTLGFMFAPLAAPGSILKIEGISFQAAVHPFRMRQTEKARVLHDTTSDQVLAEREGGAVGLQASNAGQPAELMRLTEVPQGRVTAAMSRFLQALLSVLPADLNGPDMLDVLAQAVTLETADIAQAVFRLLPKDQISWLGSTLLGLPSHLERMAAAYPGDIWTNQGLSGLRQWLHTRRDEFTKELTPEWDFLAAAALNGPPTSAGHMLNMAARAGVPPRHSVCVVATARNEGLYLLEWIAYHRLIGAGAVFIYSNDNSDGSDDLLRALAAAGEITWVENNLKPGTVAQFKAYGHAFGLLPGILDFRWSLVIDLDEFFGFDVNRFRSLPDYILWQEVQTVDAVSLNWLVFGSSGTSSWTDTPLVERFTKRLPWIDAHIKSLSRSNMCVQSRPHHAVFGPFKQAVVRDSESLPYEFGDEFSFAKTPRADHAWIAHYFLKSAEEFVWKTSRNRGDQAVTKELDPSNIQSGFAEMFLKQHTSPTMVDDCRTAACAPGLRAEINRLRALPGVSVAEQTIVKHYDKSIHELVAILRTSRGLQTAGLPYPALAALCR
jgi:hypothetical protein